MNELLRWLVCEIWCGIQKLVQMHICQMIKHKCDDDAFSTCVLCAYQCEFNCREKCKDAQWLENVYLDEYCIDKLQTCTSVHVENWASAIKDTLVLIPSPCSLMLGREVTHIGSLCKSWQRQTKYRAM